MYFLTGDVATISHYVCCYIYYSVSTNVCIIFCSSDVFSDRRLPNFFQGWEEWLRACRVTGKITKVMITDEQLKELFSTIDADHSGHVGVEEFVAYLEPSSKEVAALEEAGTARGSIFGRPGDK